MCLDVDIPFNIYLSQLVRLRGQYIFLHFCDFQTLNPWFPPKYSPVATTEFALQTWGYFGYRAIVLPKQHIVHCNDVFSSFKSQLILIRNKEAFYQARFLSCVPSHFFIKRWKGEGRLRKILEAGIKQMGEAGTPYRIGNVKKVYGVVSVYHVCII